MKYQVIYGNKPDLEVFKEDPRVGPYNGGFCWSTTKEGYIYWDRILGKMKDRIDKEKMKKQNFKCYL